MWECDSERQQSLRWDRGAAWDLTGRQAPSSRGPEPKPLALGTVRATGTGGHVPLGVANWMRTLLQPRVMMKDCLPTRLHSVSRDTEHLNTHTSSSARREAGVSRRPRPASKVPAGGLSVFSSPPSAFLGSPISSAVPQTPPWKRCRVPWLPTHAVRTQDTACPVGEDCCPQGTRTKTGGLPEAVGPSKTSWPRTFPSGASPGTRSPVHPTDTKVGRQ